MPERGFGHARIDTQPGVRIPTDARPNPCWQALVVGEMTRIRRGTPQREPGQSNPHPANQNDGRDGNLSELISRFFGPSQDAKILARGVVGQLSQMPGRVSNAGRAAAWALFSHAPSPPPRSQSSMPGPLGHGLPVFIPAVHAACFLGRPQQCVSLPLLRGPLARRSPIRMRCLFHWPHPSTFQGAGSLHIILMRRSSRALG
jgi:hypothetical protein